MFDNQITWTLVASLLVTAGVKLPISPALILLAIAIAGSLASAVLRKSKGYIKDVKWSLFAVICGVVFSYSAIPWVNKTLHLEGLESGIFVFLLALMGARVVKFIATDFDVGGFINGIMDRFKR